MGESSDTNTTPNNQSASYVNNQGYNTASILAIRLDTQQILEQIECYLKGQIKTEDIKDGVPIVVLRQIGTRKCNDDGIQGIMGYVQSIVNSAVVQGNVKPDQWLRKNFRHRWQFCKMLVTNTKRWEIEDSNIEPICDECINMIYYFTSRLIDNKERESYSNYSQSQITSTKTGSSGIFGMFGGSKQ